MLETLRDLIARFLINPKDKSMKSTILSNIKRLNLEPSELVNYLNPIQDHKAETIKKINELKSEVKKLESLCEIIDFSYYDFIFDTSTVKKIYLIIPSYWMKLISDQICKIEFKEPFRFYSFYFLRKELIYPDIEKGKIDIIEVPIYIRSFDKTSLINLVMGDSVLNLKYTELVAFLSQQKIRF